MSQIIGSPKFSAIDSNGNPLVGGKLYSYSAGTSTPLATYPTIADADAQTNANSNPVILDSRGEANVVINSATKLVLTASDGSPSSPIWSVDNIIGNLNNQLSSITDSNGNTILSLPKVNGSVNYVAIGNNVTGSAPTIASAGSDTNIDLTLSAKGSGTVRINDTLTVVNAATLSSTLAVTGNTTISGTLTVGGSSITGNSIHSINVQTFTSSGTYTPTSGMLYAMIDVLGGGGGGGGSTANNTNGGGGGAAALARRVFTAAQVGSSATVTIGAAGTAGTAGNAGGNGGSSSVALTGTGTITITSSGGSGGAAGNSTQTLGGAGGTCTNATVSVVGMRGEDGGTSTTVSGSGGSSVMGGGGRAVHSTSAAAGRDATGYGAGGGGCNGTGTPPSQAGGAGTQGIVVITEYVS